MIDWRRSKWRAGRKVGRTIYAQIGQDPSDDDVLIGVMDTRPLADEVVEAHNARLAMLALDRFARGVDE